MSRAEICICNDGFGLNLSCRVHGAGVARPLLFDADTERVLEHVRSRKDWYLESTCGRFEIRRRMQHGWGVVRCCPISSIADAPPDCFSEVGEALGIPFDTTRAIVAAADGFDTCNRPLRAALLEAAGLSEKEG